MLSLQNEPESWRKSANDDEIFGECWERGELGYKVLDYQRPIYDDIKAKLWGNGGYRNPSGSQRKYLPEIHRKFGKTTVCGIIASELCRQVEGARVFWAAETARQVGLFLRPIMQEIIEDCPAKLRPRWYRSDGMWVWPGTEGQIIVGGCEDEAKCDRLRGPQCHLFVIDEAGQIAMLHYLYTSVVLWMVSRTGGRVIMPSSPATSPGHAFTAFCVLAEAGEGGYAHRDVYDSCFTEQQLDELAKECGGRDTPQWRREALALRVVDEQRAIIPEFTPREAEIVAPLCVRCGVHFDKHADERCADGESFQWAHDFDIDEDGNIVLGKPDYRDCYVSGDPGWHPDLFALLFGYWHFRRATLIVEDELEFSMPTTEDIARGVAAVEARVWGKYFDKLRREHRADEAKPYKRVSDIQLQLICDLNRLHDLGFVNTRKDDLEAQINEARLFCKHLKLAVHPRCRRFIAHLKAGIWNAKRSSFERIKGFGHFDFCAAYIYLVRNLDRSHNPYPEIPFGVTSDTHWIRRDRINTVPEHLRGWQQAFDAMRGGV